MPNSFTNSTTGTAPSAARGTRRSETATPLTLGDAMEMDLEQARHTRFDELQGTSYFFENGFNCKFPQTVSR